ncbi:MAG: HAD-IA family hydrolase [Deltaproteobacteria bacterium]|nr:HAD-IA family hydrolase [Candidatus Zymogenaceae bacterium]
MSLNGKREVDLFLFDLDGTLADSKKDLAAAINHALKSLGMNPLTEDEIVTLVGSGISKMLKNAAGENEEEKFNTMRSYIEYLDSHLLDHTVPFPGVMDTLSNLEKKKAVVTNKLNYMAEKVLSGLELLPYIDLIIGSDSTPKMKPEPEPILLALEKFGTDPARTVMVGDTVDDIESARAAGVIACGVTYGFGTRDSLEEAGAHVIIDRITDLDDYFE